MFEPIDRVMKMRRGDSAVPRRTQIAGQDHMLSYITPQEAGILQLLGGSGRPGPAGIPAFDGHVGGADVDSGPGAAAGFGGGDTDPERGDDKDQRQMGMSPGRAQAQFGKVGPAIFAGATDDQIADSGFRTRALADYRDLGRGRGLFGRPTFDSTYNTNMARNYIDLISRQFGPMGQKEYNEAMGVTASNPFGYEGLFSRRFGVDPRNIRSTLTQDQGQRVAQKKFDRYSDFTAQDPQSQGRAFGALPLGALTRPTGEITSQGYVRRMVQDPEDIPLGQALAVQGLALAGGIPGLLAVEMMDPFSSFAPARSPEYDPALDPEINPDLPTSANLAAAQRTGLGLGALFDRAKSGFSSPSPTVDQTQTPVPKERSVFDNFKTNIMKIPETIEDLFTPAPVVATSSLDFMPRGASPDLAGFESRFAPAPAPEIGSVFEVDGRSFLATVGGPVELKGTPEQEVRTERPLAEEGRLRDPNEFFGNVTGQLAAPLSSYTTEYGLSDQGQRLSRQSFVPDGIQNISMVPAGEFFSQNPEALAAIDSDAVRSSVMNPETRQGFFVDDVTGEISRELPGGSGIRAVVGQIPGMEAPVDFSLPSLSDLTEGIAGIGSAIRGLGSNPYRAEAERRRTTSGNVFRPSN